MPVSIPDARLISDDALEVLRLPALHGCELGYSEVELAQLLGVARETISRWWTAYSTGGLAALPQDRSCRPLGAGRFLNGHKSSTSKNWEDLIPTP